MILRTFSKNKRIQAEDALKKGNVDKAVDLFKKHLDAEPGDLKVRRTLADLLRDQGRVEEAVDQYEALAGAYAAQGLLLRAISACKAILDIAPEHTETQATLAKLYAKKRGHDDVTLPAAMSTALRSGLPAAVDDETELDDADILVEEESVELSAEEVAESGTPDEFELEDDDVIEHTAQRLPPTPPPNSFVGEAPLPGEFDEVDDTAEHGLPVIPMHTVDGDALEVVHELDADPVEVDEVAEVDEVDEVDEAEIELDADDVMVVEIAGSSSDSAASIHVDELPTSPLFSDLPRHAFEELVTGLGVVLAPAGQRIVEQAEYGDSFYIIVAGRVRVEREVAGERQVLGHLSDGDFFGEMAILSRNQRSASVVCEEPTELLEVQRSVLETIVEHYPSVDRVLKRFCRERLLANLVRTSSLLSDLDPTVQRDVVKSFKIADARLGEVVIEQGKPSTALFVILSGEVEVSCEVDGAVETIEQLAEGDVFGERGLFFAEPAIATVTALKNTQMLRLTKSAFTRFRKRYPSLEERLQRISEERMAKTQALAGIAVSSHPSV